jgi:hypothetical protein
MKHKVPVPVFSCRVWPDFRRTKHRGPQYEVRIYRTRKDYLAALKAEHYWGIHDTGAIFGSLTHYNIKGHRTRLWGRMNFRMPKFGPGIISHEATHAALDYVKRKTNYKIIPLAKWEETIALAVGEIVRQTECALEQANYLRDLKL